MIHYKGRVRVVGLDKLCFPADPSTLEALATGCYDPDPWSWRDDGAVEVMSIVEWYARRADIRDADMSSFVSPEDGH